MNYSCLINFQTDWNECQEEISCNWKTYCRNSEDSYECLCKQGFLEVGDESNFPKKEDCVIPPDIIKNQSLNTFTDYCKNMTCGNNTFCENSEKTYKCECKTSFVGNPYSSSGCQKLVPSLILLIEGKINIPLLFQMSLNYTYSDEFLFAIHDIELIIDKILRMVTGYMNRSTKVTDLKPGYNLKFRLFLLAYFLSENSFHYLDSSNKLTLFENIRFAVNKQKI